MKEPVIWVALITQAGTLIGIVISARSARGAKNAATGARVAATEAKNAGQSDHADHTEQLAAMNDTLRDIRRDVGGLRQDDRDLRRELHDHDRTLRTELHDLRQKINRHIGLGD